MFHFFMQIPKSLLHQLLIFLLLISLSNFPGANSQTSNPTTSNNTNGDLNQYPYANFNPSIAIIIVVLVAALFFMGFFSIYIRHCADDTSGGSVRNLLSMNTRRANAARGIEESVLETFPTFSYAEVKDHKFGKGALECAVCLNEFEDTETLRLIPRCDHVFHAECIDAWLQGHVTCPVCRADLTPKTGEEEQSDPLPESTIPEIPDNQTVRNDDVTVQIDTQERSEVKPEVKRNLSFGNVNRPTRNDSMKGGAARRNIVGGFRSHSTGHSLVQPGENLDRFTLRLPHEIRKEMMNRALLNRTKSFAPRNGGSTRGYGDGSSRGGRSFRRIEQSDRNARSDRWGLSRAVPFFSRASSLRSPKVVAENSEGSTSRSIKNTVRMPSFKCLEPRSADETGLIQANSDRPPV